MKHLLLLVTLVLLGCSKEPSAIDQWVSKMRDKCFAMGGSSFFDDDTLIVDCYRHAFARNSKKLFSEKYTGAAFLLEQRNLNTVWVRET